MGRKRKNAVVITEKVVKGFENYLFLQERTASTVRKYVPAVWEFGKYLDGREANKETALLWKKHMVDEGKMQAATINVKLAAVNAFFKHLGHGEYKVKLLTIQKRTFRDPSKELTKAEYDRMCTVGWARGKKKETMILTTLGGTGIRVSELRFITMEAVKAGRAIINKKGKVRTILISKKLKRKLKQYAKDHNISSGEIFLGKEGKSLSARQIWGMLKELAKLADVEPSKVFPHNIRHLFAREHYNRYHDIVKLADILGHSSIETTRIYLISTGEEHAKEIDDLNMLGEE